MKINNWSVVKSPRGLSLRHIKNGKISSNGEVCVSVVEGYLTVSVHVDCVDDPVGVLNLETDTLKPRVNKLKRRRKTK
jgi:hypothetical protein